MYYVTDIIQQLVENGATCNSLPAINRCELFIQDLYQGALLAIGNVTLLDDCCKLHRVPQIVVLHVILDVAATKYQVIFTGNNLC